MDPISTSHICKVRIFDLAYCCFSTMLSILYSVYYPTVNGFLSILELLEYDLSRNDINHVLSNGVIAIDKSTSSAYSSDIHTDYGNILVSGDYYFYNFLNSKVKLTDIGLCILGSKRCRETTK